MTALSDAYAGTVASKRGRSQLVLGVGLFLVGAILVVAGIAAAGSGVLTSRGYSIGEARWVAGILGGIGVPAVFLGIFTILPATRSTRAAAVIGASIAVFGVALFAHAYPCQWIGNTCQTAATDLTLPTAGVYFLGTLTTFWCLFVGVANFKTRNDPGGTVTMEVTRQGETKVIEVERSELGGLGSVGLFGSGPDGDVETQTNGPSPSTGTAAATSDGGSDAEVITSPGSSSEPASTDTPQQPRVDQVDSRGSTDRQAGSTGGQSASTTQSGRADRSSSRESSGEWTTPTPSTASENIDRYCGSCAQFQYVRTKQAGLQPYCALHDELMDDMESCEEWEPR
jgi:hypothetical protein